MKIRNTFSLLIIVALLTACEKEALSPSPISQAEAEKLATADLETAEALYTEWQKELADLWGVVDGATPRSGNFVILPAGSVDGLQAAIDEAGDRGVVYVEPGMHTESGTVTVTHNNIRIIARNNAHIQFDISPSDIGEVIEPAFHIKNASQVTISGLELSVAEGPGGTAFLVQESPRARIVNNRITDYQFGVLVERSTKSFTAYNFMQITTAWQTGELFDAYGIVVANGARAVVFNNEIRDAIFGLWACDEDGLALNNNFHHNLYGLILCNVPEAAFPLSDGSAVGSETPGASWRVSWNISNNNLSTGYLVIDGANNNLLTGNSAEGNAQYDYELTGDTERFGFLTPKSYENTAFVHNSDTVKDCGDDNEVVGGIQIDTTVDLCF